MISRLSRLNEFCHCLIDVFVSMANYRCQKLIGQIYIDDLCEHISLLSSNASHEDKVAFFPPQGIISSTFRREIPRPKFSHNFFTAKRS